MQQCSVIIKAQHGAMNIFTAMKEQHYGDTLEWTDGKEIKKVQVHKNVGVTIID
jgi:hypothetical protein